MYKLDLFFISLQLSTLLLYYEQESCSEDSHRPRQPRFMQILKHKVEETIGLHQFTEVSSLWILKALECIGQCVEVDPSKKPGVKELLRHPFLY